jgi:hypothetical protein
VPARKFVGKTYRLNFDIPQGMRDELYEVAALEGVPATDLVRRIIREYLDSGMEPVRIERVPNSEKEIFFLFVNQMRLLTDKFSDMFSMLENHKAEFGNEKSIKAMQNALFSALIVANGTKKSEETIEFLKTQLKVFYSITDEEIETRLAESKNPTFPGLDME